MQALGSMKGGFTLVETLVVCAILAVLSALVTSAVIGAKNSAKASTCVARQSQLAKAIFLYAADNDQHFPPFGTRATDPLDTRPLRTDLVEKALEPFGAKKELFFCPLDSKAKTTSKGEFNTFELTSYEFRFTKNPASSAGDMPASLSIGGADPSKFVIIFDQSWIEKINGKLVRSSAHGEYANFAYLDGHVKRDKLIAAE